MPLSGEAIRTMNFVDDISGTLRRIEAVLPLLNEEERKLVVEAFEKAEPNYSNVLEALKK